MKVRLWINDRDPAARSPEWDAMLKERFGTSAIPLYVLLSPRDEVLGVLDFPGGSPEAFARTMAAWIDSSTAKFR